MADNKKKKKRRGASWEDRPITFNELVEARKQEMQSVLPGHYTVVKDPEGIRKDVKVYSPSYKSRACYSMGINEEGK